MFQRIWCLPTYMDDLGHLLHREESMANNSSFLVKLLKVLISHSHHETGKKETRPLFLNNVLLVTVDHAL